MKHFILVATLSVALALLLRAEEEIAVKRISPKEVLIYKDGTNVVANCSDTGGELEIQIIPVEDGEKEAPRASSANPSDSKELTDKERKELNMWRKVGNKPVTIKVEEGNLIIGWAGTEKTVELKPGQKIKVQLAPRAGDTEKKP